MYSTIRFSTCSSRQTKAFCSVFNASSDDFGTQCRKARLTRSQSYAVPFPCEQKYRDRHGFPKRLEDRQLCQCRFGYIDIHQKTQLKEPNPLGGECHYESSLSLQVNVWGIRGSNPAVACGMLIEVVNDTVLQYVVGLLLEFCDEL